MAKSTLIFRGDFGTPEGHYSRTVLWDITDVAALNTLGSALVAHTDCNLAKRSFIDEVAVNDVAPGGTPPVNIDRRALLYLRDEATGKVFHQELPAPVAADCENTDNGERLTAAAVTALASLFATATGKTLTGLWGKVIQTG